MLHETTPSLQERRAAGHPLYARVAGRGHPDDINIPTFPQEGGPETGWERSVLLQVCRAAVWLGTELGGTGQAIREGSGATRPALTRAQP